MVFHKLITFCGKLNLIAFFENANIEVNEGFLNLIDPRK